MWWFFFFFNEEKKWSEIPVRKLYVWCKSLICEKYSLILFPYFKVFRQQRFAVRFGMTNSDLWAFTIILRQASAFSSMIKFKIKLLTSYGNICCKQTWDFLHQEQNITLYYLLLILWVLICMCLVYVKQLENVGGGRSPRPDDTRLGLLQGTECEIAEILMRTYDISWKISSCSWQLTKHQCGIYFQMGEARSRTWGDGQAAWWLRGNWMRISGWCSAMAGCV